MVSIVPVQVTPLELPKTTLVVLVAAPKSRCELLETVSATGDNPPLLIVKSWGMPPVLSGN